MREPEVDQPLDREDHGPLVAVGDRHEDRSLVGQPADRAELRLGERRAEVACRCP